MTSSDRLRSYTNTVCGCELNYGMSWYSSVVDFVNTVMDIWVTLRVEFLKTVSFSGSLMHAVIKFIFVILPQLMQGVAVQMWSRTDV